MFFAKKRRQREFSLRNRFYLKRPPGSDETTTKNLHWKSLGNQRADKVRWNDRIDGGVTLFMLGNTYLRIETGTSRSNDGKEIRIYACHRECRDQRKRRDVLGEYVAWVRLAGVANEVGSRRFLCERPLPLRILPRFSPQRAQFEVA
jgi:hypothetical protein